MGIKSLAGIIFKVFIGFLFVYLEHKKQFLTLNQLLYRKLQNIFSRLQKDLNQRQEQQPR